MSQSLELVQNPWKYAGDNPAPVSKLARKAGYFSTPINTAVAGSLEIDIAGDTIWLQNNQSSGAIISIFISFDPGQVNPIRVDTGQLIKFKIPFDRLFISWLAQVQGAEITSLFIFPPDTFDFATITL